MSSLQPARVCSTLTIQSCGQVSDTGLRTSSFSCFALCGRGSRAAQICNTLTFQTSRAWSATEGLCTLSVRVCACGQGSRAAQICSTLTIHNCGCELLRREAFGHCARVASILQAHQPLRLQQDSRREPIGHCAWDIPHLHHINLGGCSGPQREDWRWRPRPWPWGPRGGKPRNLPAPRRPILRPLCGVGGKQNVGRR